MSGLHDEAPNATPLSPAERDGLIPAHITLRQELNEAEQANILAAAAWAFARRRDVFNEAFLRNLHRRMFNRVWRWAGQFRESERNIGIQAYRIPTELRRVIDDASYWIEHKTYPLDEIAVRYHHALVFIHPFPNGNGRWSRLVADVLMAAHSAPRLTWGRSALRDADATRAAYVQALRAADSYDFGPLLAFARG